MLRSPTGQTEVWIALPHGQVAWALLGVALGFTAAAWEAVLTVRVALAELLTEILSHDARAGAVARMLRVVTGLVVVHLGG